MKATGIQDTQADMHPSHKKSKTITYPYTIRTVLSENTRDELKNIGDLLNIAIKSTDKKQERIDKIYKGMTENQIIERYLLCMPENEWDLLGKLVSYEKACPLRNDSDLPALTAGMYLGHDEEGYIIIPQEVKECFQTVCNSEFMVRRNKMTWLQQCVSMANNLYGAMPLPVLVTLYNQHYTFQSNAMEIRAMLQIIPEAMRLYYQKDGFICNILMTEENVSALERNRQTHVYYIPTQEEIEHEATGNIIYFTPPMIKQGMMKLHKYTSISKDETLHVMKDVIDEMASGWGPKDILEELQSMQITIRKGDKKRLLELFAEWNRYTKKWVNCGYSDDEMEIQE